MNKRTIKEYAADIRTWITVFFLIRLIGITNAPLEIGHNWRQSLTNMIARNFYENGADLLHPMIDMAGERSGIIGSEFPFFNYLIFVMAKLFGYAHWHGRLIALIVSSIGLYYFYKLLAQLHSKKLAFSATIILCVSIWFTFSRKIMPDTFSVSLLIIGLYFAYRYLMFERKVHLALFFLFATLGMLCKIPALSLFAVLIVPLFLTHIPNARKLKLYTAALLSVLIVFLWYFVWVPHLVATYQYQLYFPKSLVEGIEEIAPLIPNVLEIFYFSAFSSFIAFTCFLGGLFILLKFESGLLKVGIGIVFLTFLLFIIKTGAVFPHHSYYVIPFVPVMALIAGLFIAKLPKKTAYILLGIIAIEAIANQQHDLFLKKDQQYKLALAPIVDKLVEKNGLIIINGGASPQLIYFAHRKGWSLTNDILMQHTTIDSLVALGATHLVIDRAGQYPEFIDRELAFQNDHYSIYALNKEK